MQSLFSTAYLPPISYFQKCVGADEILIDQHEHFIKQTFRNRCNIYGPNGKQTLIIPVNHDDVYRKPINEIKISFDSRWNKIHWKSITSAYRNSPYFEYYEDKFQEIFENPPEKLFDFNMILLKQIIECFKIKKTFHFTSTYEKNPESVVDLRNEFHPKKENTKIDSYHQVFSDRHGFINDLSCVDYLFNVGPDL